MTVASVGPYSTHASAAGNVRFISPSSSAGTASPPTKARRIRGKVAPEPTSCRISAGTVCTVVASATSSTRRSASSTRSRGTSRTVPPEASGTSTSKTPMSKAKEAIAGVTSSGPIPNTAHPLSTRSTALRCSTPTPLGRPVEPEV